MELREPPKPTQRRRPTLAVLLVVQSLLLVLAVGWIAWSQLKSPAGDGSSQLREVSSKLRAAGALGESARILDEFLSRQAEGAAHRGNLAYTLGQTYLELGETERALRWFYEAEMLSEGPVREELGRKIVHSLERLGRFQAAQAALSSRVGLPTPEDDGVERPDEDPVVARIGRDEIRRSQVERALDELPPQLAQAMASPEQRQSFVQQYVGEELLWRKAKKLEYDQDPEVRRQLERVWRQLAMTRFIEEEVVAKIRLDEVDLRNFFAANQTRYTPAEGEAPSFEEVRSAVERDYRQQKVQSAYGDFVESQLAAEDVELFAERMSDDS